MTISGNRKSVKFRKVAIIGIRLAPNASGRYSLVSSTLTPSARKDNMENSTMIAMIEARESCKGKKNLKARILAAMKVTKHHWLVPKDGERFQAAVAAAMLESTEVEKERVKEEMDALKHLDAILSGVGTLGDIKAPKHPIGIAGMWNGLK